MAAVAVKATENDYKYGFINNKGEMVIQPKYDYADYFREGYARVNVGTVWSLMDSWKRSRLGGKWGFIDREGNLVIDTVFDYADPFYKGIARVFVFESRDKDISKAKIGYIDRQGNWVWEPTK